MSRTSFFLCLLLFSVATATKLPSELVGFTPISTFGTACSSWLPSVGFASRGTSFGEGLLESPNGGFDQKEMIWQGVEEPEEICSAMCVSRNSSWGVIFRLSREKLQHQMGVGLNSLSQTALTAYVGVRNGVISFLSGFCSWLERLAVFIASVVLALWKNGILVSLYVCYRVILTLLPLMPVLLFCFAITYCALRVSLCVFGWLLSPVLGFLTIISDTRLALANIFGWQKRWKPEHAIKGLDLRVLPGERPRSVLTAYRGDEACGFVTVVSTYAGTTAILTCLHVWEQATSFGNLHGRLKKADFEPTLVDRNRDVLMAENGKDLRVIFCCKAALFKSMDKVGPGLASFSGASQNWGCQMIQVQPIDPFYGGRYKTLCHTDKGDSGLPIFRGKIVVGVHSGAAYENFNLMGGIMPVEGYTSAEYVLETTAPGEGRLDLRFLEEYRGDDYVIVKGRKRSVEVSPVKIIVGGWADQAEDDDPIDYEAELQKTRDWLKGIPETSGPPLGNKFYINTTNAGKQKDYVLCNPGMDLEFGKIEVPEIQGNLREVVEAKYKAVSRLGKTPADRRLVVEDTALDIDGNWPGVYIKYVSDLAGFIGKLATLRIGVAIQTSGDDFEYSERTMVGHIVPRRGDQGFGFDPWFEFDGKTLAELSGKEKADFGLRSLNACPQLVSGLPTTYPLTTSTAEEPLNMATIKALFEDLLKAKLSVDGVKTSTVGEGKKKKKRSKRVRRNRSKGQVKAGSASSPVKTAGKQSNSSTSSQPAGSAKN